MPATPATPPRPRTTLLAMLLLWVAFYASFTLFAPPLLDDADSVHAEVAREMLLRHDYITLYANGIRYLEKAPLLYWAMAACMKLSMLFGAASPRALAAAARLPAAFSMLGLAWIVEVLARSMFRSARAGLYAALITLSSFGLFIFSRLTLPDTSVCLWIALSMLCFWQTEQDDRPTRAACLGFAAACAFNVLTKGLIGIVFPIGIVVLYLLLTRGLRGALRRMRELHVLPSLLMFLAIATPWHILAGLANPTQGHPAPFTYVGGHWQVPLPSDGNVRGWFWFYFINEHLLRYLNLRVPRDYDTSPLWLFWGLCLVWVFPWSAFLFHAIADAIRQRNLGGPSFRALAKGWGIVCGSKRPYSLTPASIPALPPSPPRICAQELLLLWAALPLLFFSLSTRQEYYVLPSIPAFAIVIAAWLAPESHWSWSAQTTAAGAQRKATSRCLYALLAFGSVYGIGSAYFLFTSRVPAPGTDLATLLAQNPADYTLSMGHFLDLTARALGLFHPSLVISGASLFLGPLAALLLRRRGRAHAANLALVAQTCGLLLAAHLALQTFSPVLSSAQLAQQIAPQVHPEDLVVIHGEYESGSTLGFYLQRPAVPGQEIHILEGRSSNLWYGSFFADAPRIFETPQSFAAKWAGPQRIFLWQATSLPDAPRPLTNLPAPVYVIASGGGKEILSNQPNR